MLRDRPSIAARSFFEDTLVVGFGVVAKERRSDHLNNFINSYQLILIYSYKNINFSRQDQLIKSWVICNISNSWGIRTLWSR